VKERYTFQMCCHFVQSAAYQHASVLRWWRAKRYAVVNSVARYSDRDVAA